ncbi:transmembrane 4 L6 family member 5-like isoform X1 [Arapaima gigas]
MCTGKCSLCIGVVLYPLALISVICNILLFFPEFKTIYAQEDRDGVGPRITEQAKYMSGVIGGGVMVLIPAIHIHLTGTRGCCGNRCGMFLSIAFAAVGVVGAIYSLSVSITGLVYGPVCQYYNIFTGKLEWGTPFVNFTESYLKNEDLWSMCLLPKNVVEFNIGLFSAMLVAACLEGVLCTSQMINGLLGCICGTCNSKERS